MLNDSHTDSNDVNKNVCQYQKIFFYFANQLDESPGRCSDSALKLGSHLGVGFHISPNFFQTFPLKKISKIQTLCYLLCTQYATKMKIIMLSRYIQYATKMKIIMLSIMYPVCY